MAVTCWRTFSISYCNTKKRCVVRNVDLTADCSSHSKKLSRAPPDICPTFSVAECVSNDGRKADPERNNVHLHKFNNINIHGGVLDVWSHAHLDIQRHTQRRTVALRRKSLTQKRTERHIPLGSSYTRPEVENTLALAQRSW